MSMSPPAPPPPPTSDEQLDRYSWLCRNASAYDQQIVGYFTMLPNDIAREIEIDGDGRYTIVTRLAPTVNMPSLLLSYGTAPTTTMRLELPALPPEERPDARARRLLEQWLTAEELHHHDAYGCIMVSSPQFPDIHYRIPADGGMVKVIYKGYGVNRLCLVPRFDSLPYDDMTVALKLYVTASEREYWRTAYAQGAHGFYRYDEHGAIIGGPFTSYQGDLMSDWMNWNPFVAKGDAPALPT